MCHRGGSFALIKTKCLPVLLYGTPVCPTNAADLQSMQFTIKSINRVIIKLFGTMSQNYYQEVRNYFGINTVKELIHNRFQKFRISYGAADNYICRLIFAKCWTYFDCTVHIFCFFSWLPFSTVKWRHKDFRVRMFGTVSRLWYVRTLSMRCWTSECNRRSGLPVPQTSAHAPRSPRAT